MCWRYLVQQVGPQPPLKRAVQLSHAALLVVLPARQLWAVMLCDKAGGTVQCQKQQTLSVQAEALGLTKHLDAPLHFV